VPLGELAAIGSQNEGVVAVTRGRSPQSREQHHLPGGVGDVVLAPDDVGDLHACVIHHHGEVVRVAAVGALDDEVADDLGGETYGPVDEVVEGHVPCRHPEADGGRFPGGKPRLDHGRVESKAGAVVLGHQAPGQLFLPPFVEQFLGAEAGIGPPVRQQPAHRRLVQPTPLALPVGSVGASHIGTLIGAQPQPGQVAKETGLMRPRRALEVGVFDAEHHGAAVMTGIEEVIESRTGAADMKRSGRTGSEAHTHAARPAAVRRRAGLPVGGRHGLSSVAAGPIRATAWAAMPSPRPVKPRPSVVVPRSDTRSTPTPIAAASRARIAAR